jgi:hypothetical protein
MNTKRLSSTCLATIVCASLTVNASWRGAPSSQPVAELLAMGLQGASGSTVGPDGALYVTEGALGRVSRVDPKTGAITTFASGLPPAIAAIGGAIDVAFIGRTAYVLVTLVGADVGGNPSDVVGIYRVDGPRRFKVVADLGTFSRLNPPERDFQIDVPSGVQYALEVYRGAFLVTDGHHNRVLRATVHGEVSEVIAFDNVVPTGLQVSGPLVFMAQAGPVPHLPEDGKVVVFLPKRPFALEVASGGRLLVDVEFRRNRTLYAVSQGEFPGGPPGAPALPNTGALLKANWDGTLTVVADGLNQPTSLEFIRDTAYVVTLGGEIWKIDLGGHERWRDDDDN